MISLTMSLSVSVFWGIESTASVSHGNCWNRLMPAFEIMFEIKPCDLSTIGMVDGVLSVCCCRV